MRLTGWPRINLGHYIGILLGCGGVLTYIYGLTVGVRQVKVNHLTRSLTTSPQPSTATRSSISPTSTSAPSTAGDRRFSKRRWTPSPGSTPT